MPNRRVFLAVDILPEGIEEWNEAYQRMEAFVIQHGAMYGFASDLKEFDDEQRATIMDLYASDPNASSNGPGRSDMPPSTSAGKLTIELYDDQVPKAAENFFRLCTGDKGKGKAGKQLHYKGCPIHRVLKGFCLQGGDIVKGDGSAGDSIYGNASLLRRKKKEFVLHLCANVCSSPRWEVQR